MFWVVKHSGSISRVSPALLEVDCLELMFIVHGILHVANIAPIEQTGLVLFVLIIL